MTFTFRNGEVYRGECGKAYERKCDVPGCQVIVRQDLGDDMPIACRECVLNEMRESGWSRKTAEAWIDG